MTTTETKPLRATFPPEPPPTIDKLRGQLADLDRRLRPPAPQYATEFAWGGPGCEVLELLNHFVETHGLDAPNGIVAHERRIRAQYVQLAERESQRIVAELKRILEHRAALERAGVRLPDTIHVTDLPGVSVLTFAEQDERGGTTHHAVAAVDVGQLSPGHPFLRTISDHVILPVLGPQPLLGQPQRQVVLGPAPYRRPLPTYSIDSINEWNRRYLNATSGHRSDGGDWQ